MRYLSLLLLYTTTVFGQDPYMDLNEGFREIGEVFLATAGDAESLSLARNPMIGPCREDGEQEEREIDLGLVPEEDAESKWRFSVMVTMGGPREGLAKNYADMGEEYLAMGREVDNIIAQNFSSRESRSSAIKAACEGRSEMDRIAMASNLASRLSKIYDHDRANGGVNGDMVVTSQNQWEALHARAGGDYGATAGVCRDASLTVSQFLLDCGFKPGQVSIEGYRTVGGGHQVTTVRTSDGQAYTINWSELYASDESSGANPAPNTNLINTGLYYTVYDPENGNVVERRRTELGEVLKAVTGGSVEDPNYLPQLMKLEAGYGVITANVFKTETERGDIAQGIATYIQADDVFGILDVSAGVAYARNERSVATSAINEATLSQDIVYGQIEGRFRIPSINLIDRDDRSLALRPTAVVTTEGYYSRDSQNGQPGEVNRDMYSEATLGLDALYNQGRFGAYIGGEVDVNASIRATNNQRGTPGESGDDGGITPFANSYNVHGGISWDGDRFTTAATADYTIARSGTRTSLGATLMDHESNSSYSAVYSVYDRRYGIREDFVVIRAERDFQINRVGTVNVGAGIQVPISNDFNETTVGLSLRFYPGRRR